MKYQCPVCLYPGLARPPKDDYICPCCGTHFGYDDFSTTWDKLREGWIYGGAVWFSDSTPKPQGWDPHEQLYGRISLYAPSNDLFTIVIVGNLSSPLYA